MQEANLNYRQRAAQLKPRLVEWRRRFHRYPELSYQEEQTSSYILERLEELKVFDIQKGIAGFGIVAALGTGKGPAIGIRADMDALPIQETTGLAYASIHQGVMHACGHDAHTAILLGSAALLAEDYKAGKLTGTVKFIFQPAEEDTDLHGLTGAPYFLQSGLLSDLEAVIALHMCPWRRAGELQINHGPSMASVDNFTLTVKGTGGHAGYPHQGIDPVWIATHILQALYGLISRKLNPLEVGAISIGAIEGGTTFNVIPESVKIKGTIRAYTKETRTQLIKELEATTTIAAAFGAKAYLDLQQGEPALVNDRDLTDLFRETACSLYPEMVIYKEPFGMGGEDFSHIAERIPGAMVFLGCGWEDRPAASLHTPEFVVNEDALPIGVSLLAETARQWLEKHRTSLQ